MATTRWSTIESIWGRQFSLLAIATTICEEDQQRNVKATGHGAMIRLRAYVSEQTDLRLCSEYAV